MVLTFIVKKEEVKALFSLNNSSIAYLIHGQYFRLGYNINNCWFCFFIYDNGESFFKRTYFKNNTGVFENVTNAYNPNIKIIAFGLGIKIFRFKLKINFINSKPPEIEINALNTPEPAQMKTKHKLPEFNLPKFTKSKDIDFLIDKKTIIINDHKELDQLIFDSRNK